MNRKSKPFKIGLIIVIVVMLFNVYFVNNVLFSEKSEEVTYNEFLSQLDNKNIDKVQIEGDIISYTLKAGEKDKQEPPSNPIIAKFEEITGRKYGYYYTNRVTDLKLVDRLYESGAVFMQVREETNPIISILLNLLFSFGLPMLMFYLMMRMISKRSMGGQNGVMSFGKSNAKVYVKSSEGIKFSDVAGEDEAKEALMEIVNYLHMPQEYVKIGAKMPKGALLVGPPGTGKTMLAKAVAGEANVPFFSISGSEFVEMFVGMGAAKVRDLFKQASEKAPCIVFIDEIDTIGKKRDNSGFGANDEREQTLNQLLTEMDGFDASKGVVILAASNRPEVLDPALLRAGRFDRRIPVELPDYIGREAILKVHAKKIKMSPDVDLMAIAKGASGASGADLANMINEAALRAVKEGRSVVIQEDLEESIETILAGYKRKNDIMTAKEKLIVSYHEIGHAMVAALQSNSAPVTKITIIPRTSGALGYTMQVDEEEKNLLSKTELENRIATFTAGRAAESIVFGDITTGAANDIEQATKLARAMVTRFGMSDEFGMVAMEQVHNVYLGGDSSLQCSEAYAEKIDEKVVEIVKAATDKATKLLEENRSKLDALAKYLYENETINGETFMRLLNENPNTEEE